MSSFESLVLGAPLGFAAGCSACNALEDLSSAVELAVQSARTSTGGGPSSSSSSSSSKDRAVKALVYVINARNQSQPAPEVMELASVLDLHTTLSRSCITALAAGLETYPIPTEPGLPPAQGAKPSNLHWRLGVALASSTCKSLLSPYVSLSFTVMDGNGNSTVHSSEMTYKEFQEFHGTFQLVSRKLESL